MFELIKSVNEQRKRESRLFKNSTSSSSEYIKNYAQTEFIHAQWNTSTCVRSSYIHAHTPFERARTARSIIQFLFFGNVSLSISKHTMAHRAILHMRWHLSKKEKKEKVLICVFSYSSAHHLWPTIQTRKSRSLLYRSVCVHCDELLAKAHNQAGAVCDGAVSASWCGDKLNIR